MVCEQFPFIPSQFNKNYDIFHFDNKENYYNLSTSKSLKIFYLVHMDI